MRRKRRRRLAALALLPAAALVTAMNNSAAIGASAHTARIAAQESVLTFGERFALGGMVPGDHGTKVRIRFRPAGAEGWKFLREVHTDSHGRYRVKTRARRNGAYQAVPKRGHASRPEPVAVHARSAFHVAKHNVVIGNGVRLHGRVRPGGTRNVKVVVRGPDGDVVRDVSARNGEFALRWTPHNTGNYRLRVYVGHNQRAKAGHSVARKITAFRYAEASWYGPGLYGNYTACGQTLGPDTLGVANNALPCGTKVTLRYHGNEVTVPVIDRGEFVPGREYDLTYATKQKLGFGDVGAVLTNR